LKSYLMTVLLCITAMFALQARPETSGTELVMTAHWDNGSAVEGTVTLEQLNAPGSDAATITKALSNGSASVSEPLGASTLYAVTLVTATNTQLVKFPITTAMINPQNLQRGEVDLVFRKADNSLKSAQVKVSMEF
jgi:hypothetical protein